MTTVTVSSKPQLVDKLRSVWRTSGEQKVIQLWRFVRLAVATLFGQILAQVVANGDLSSVSHLDQKAVVALLVGALETAWRQLHPALTASAVDTAPGATVVPTQLNGSPADPTALPVPATDSSNNVAIVAPPVGDPASNPSIEGDAAP